MRECTCIVYDRDDIEIEKSKCADCGERIVK